MAGHPRTRRDTRKAPLTGGSATTVNDHEAAADPHTGYLKETSSSTVTSNTTMTNPGMYVCNATGGAFTVTLPTAVGKKVNEEWDVLKSDSSANTITVATTGGQTINGESTMILYIQHTLLTVVSDGSNWRIK